MRKRTLLLVVLGALAVVALALVLRGEDGGFLARLGPAIHGR